jgi:hypothetical protein
MTTLRISRDDIFKADNLDDRNASHRSLGFRSTIPDLRIFKGFGNLEFKYQLKESHFPSFDQP